MVTYDLIIKLEEEGLLKKLLGKGIVPIRYLNDKEMYECYLEWMKDPETRGVMEAYEKTAIDFKCHIDSVRRVVIKMES